MNPACRPTPKRLRIAEMSAVCTPPQGDRSWVSLEFAWNAWFVILSNPHFRGEESSCDRWRGFFAPELAMLRMTPMAEGDPLPGDRSPLRNFMWRRPGSGSDRLRNHRGAA